jgi:hypothetical protein
MIRVCAAARGFDANGEPSGLMVFSLGIGVLAVYLTLVRIPS